MRIFDENGGNAFHFARSYGISVIDGDDEYEELVFIKFLQMLNKKNILIAIEVNRLTRSYNNL